MKNSVLPPPQKECQVFFFNFPQKMPEFDKKMGLCFAPKKKNQLNLVNLHGREEQTEVTPPLPPPPFPFKFLDLGMQTQFPKYGERSLFGKGG